jgi:hypothetical protein
MRVRELGHEIAGVAHFSTLDRSIPERLHSSTNGCGGGAENAIS